MMCYDTQYGSERYDTVLHDTRYNTVEDRYVFLQYTVRAVCRTLHGMALAIRYTTRYIIILRTMCITHLIIQLQVYTLFKLVFGAIYVPS